MKKFSFSLDNVLNYKNQILEHLQGEHALILDEIRTQEKLIEAVKNQYVSCGDGLREEQRQGITVMKIHTYENYLEVLAYRIRREQEVLEVLKKKEEIKRSQVIEAKKENSSIEKLKERKVENYNKEVQKEQELLIEEFVSHERNVSRNQHAAG